MNLGEEIRKKIEEAMRQRGRVNILVSGRSGVGKSTLINAVFQGNLAQTGQGRPVTQTVREFTKEGIPISIFDTRGLEMSNYAQTLGSLAELVEQRNADPDPHRHIHVAWLCISEGSRRVEHAETDAAEMLASKMPVLVVITKARNDGGFRSEALRLIPSARNAMRVRALAETDEEGNTLGVRGLVELVDATMELVPEAHRQAFAAAQRVSIELKVRRSEKIVAGAASGALAAGIAPIPFSDAAILVPIQIGMLAGISATFGMELNKAFISTLLSSVAGALGATVAGRALVGGLLKLLPGAGSIAGGAIAGATAATLTSTVGFVYIRVLSTLFANASGKPPSDDQVADAFAKALLEQIHEQEN